MYAIGYDEKEKGWCVYERIGPWPYEYKKVSGPMGYKEAQKESWDRNLRLAVEILDNQLEEALYYSGRPIGTALKEVLGASRLYRKAVKNGFRMTIE